MAKNSTISNNNNSFKGAASGAKKSVKGVWADYKSRFFAPKTVTLVEHPVLDESTVKDFVRGIPDEASIQVSGKEVKKTANLIQGEAKAEGFILGAGFAVAVYMAAKIGSAFGEKLAEKSY